MHKPSKYYLINGITLYRLVTAPVLTALAFAGMENIFRWMLAISFFTDLIDGFLARKFKVASVKGARLDSIADDLTILAGVTGLILLRPEFISEVKAILYSLLGLFVVQNMVAFLRYGRITSFHTYAAKLAALLQGCFLILIFFLPEPLYILFYIAAAVTAYELLEEMIISFLLPQWKTNVKGIYWVLKSLRKK